MKSRTSIIALLALLTCLATPANGKEAPVKVLFPGNWADPTVTRVGDDYYLTSNNDLHVPSVLLWHSTDLRRWEPVCYASPSKLQAPATDIKEYGGRLYIYGGGGRNPWVMFAKPPYTSWSKRINLQPLARHGIDAGHITDENRNRYLYMTRGRIVKLSKDGVRAKTAPRKVYDGWPIPQSLAIECKCLESPKLFKRNGWYYMVSAQGGTGGPSTSHMAIVARSKHVDGPWQNSPHNPLIWTQDRSEAWWSTGHATLIEGPDGHWYAIYHGYPHGHRSIGRCTLISPVEWTDDDWPVLASEWPPGWDGTISLDLPLDDDFDGEELGMQWQSLGRLDRDRYSLEDGSLVVKATGDEPGTSSPLTVNPRNLAYEVETELVLEGDISAGLTLFYSADAYVSIGLSHEGRVQKHLMSPRHGPEAFLQNRAPFAGRRVRLKIVNDRQDASYYYAEPGSE